MTDEIYQKTWAGKLFGPTGSLILVRAEAQEKRQRGDPISGEVPLVSALYTASKQYFVHWREQRWNLSLLFWALWYGLGALNRALLLCRYHFAKLDYRQLDVLGAVFLRVHAFGHAQLCYETAFRLITTSVQEGKTVLPHEEALVLCGVGRVHELMGTRNDLSAAEEFYKEALHVGLRAACDRKQQVRILRAVADYFMRQGEISSAITLLETAEGKAQDEKMPDQELQAKQALKRARQLLPDR
ncbi:MAG: hypothetical protein A2542_02790 [Parcubacteria group bacterium RIFOXYD2_FULL_52_8]|nr:MAG: hypothetical protein A2542_02790 [Parcubacteria group bacterium RIFOXYD2_FULL_52_8]